MSDTPTKETDISDPNDISLRPSMASGLFKSSIKSPTSNAVTTGNFPYGKAASGTNIPGSRKRHGSSSSYSANEATVQNFLFEQRTDKKGMIIYSQGKFFFEIIFLKVNVCILIL